MRNNPIRTIAEPLRGPLVPKGYDPELLYVECGRCGSPVMWEKGKASQILGLAGIDPLELDASCMLVTDGCPMCGGKGHYTVQIFRVGGDTPGPQAPLLRQRLRAGPPVRGKGANVLGLRVCAPRRVGRKPCANPERADLPAVFSTMPRAVYE